MNDNGFVYVLMNSSMPNIVKIGKTTRSPNDRAKELSTSTGVPTPFVVAYDNYFESCTKAEQYIHTLLENKGYKVSDNREFFEISIKDAIDAVIQAKSHFGEFIPVNERMNYHDEDSREPWEDILNIAMNYQYGMGDCLQDYDEAVKYYLQAIKLGYKNGYAEIASMYEIELDNNNKAMHYYKEGISNGCIDCYAGLGLLYQNSNLNQSQRSYELYMKLSKTEDLLYIHVCQYLLLTLKTIVIDKKSEDIQYFDRTLHLKDEILNYFSENTTTTLVQEYKNYFELPFDVQEELAVHYKEAGVLLNTDDGYFATYEQTKVLSEYINYIYNKEYISPNIYDGVMFENTFRQL